MASEGATCTQGYVERLNYLPDGLRRLRDRCVGPAPCDHAVLQPASSSVCLKPQADPNPRVSGGLSLRLSANWAQHWRARKSVPICKYHGVYPPPGPCGFQHKVTEGEQVRLYKHTLRTRRAGPSGRQQTRMHTFGSTQDCPQTKRLRENLCEYTLSAHHHRLIDTYGRKHWLTCQIRHLDRGRWGGSCPGDTD